MTLLTLLLVALGGYVGGNSGAMVFFVLSLAMNFGMYWFSDKLVLKQYRAHVVEPGDEEGRFDAPLRHDRPPAPERGAAHAGGGRLGAGAAERLRHRPQPGARGGLRHPRDVGAGAARG